MERQLEPELMEDPEQARAYAEADFEEPHRRFVDLFQQQFPAVQIDGFVLDLGCGPGDISRRFALAYSSCRIHGIDGAAAMLQQGWNWLSRSPELQSRIELLHQSLPAPSLPRPCYDVVISNSLLHHLPDPSVLWTAVCQFACRQAPVFVMDLRRPPDIETAQELVAIYAAQEPSILQRDFYHSLLAAFTAEEVASQLAAAGLEHLSVAEVGDRHLTVAGRMKG
ncbi:MAG: class I SAM-dependent methyltransferase [Acidobacteriota bacterium]